MSPLGTLVAPTNNNNINNTNNSVKNSYYGINDPLLRLMSLSLASDPGSHQALAVLNSHLNLNNLSNLHCHSAVAAAAAAAAAMQFKSAGNPLNTINVPVEPVSPLMVPSPSPSGLSMSSNGGHSESPPLTIPFAAIIANSAAVAAAATTTTITANSTHPPHHHNHNNESPGNDDDEVLSIGREDDEQMVIDCDSSTLSDDNIDKECHNDRMECLDLDEHQVTSPSASDSSNSRSRPRVRNYSSSEDCLQPDHDDPSLHNGSRETSRMLKINQVGGDSGSTAASRESLMFSIANILRPDFGLGPQPSLPLPHQLQQPVKHYHNHYNYSNHHYSIKLNQQSSLTSSSRKHHHAKGLPLSLTTLPSNHKMRRSDPVIPIDLSRPSSTDSSAISPIHRKKSSHSASSDPTENRHSNGVKNFKHSVHNGTSKSKPNPNIKTSNNNESNNERSNNNSSKKETTEDTKKKNSNNNDDKLWPAWVYCTRYSDRPSSGPRTRRGRKKEKEIDEKRPRTAFTADQLSRLKKEFDENRYLTEKRRQDLAKDLRLHENQIKIWFQNKRAKLKKANGQRGGLALQLMAQGLYNHSTIGPKNELDGDDSD